MSDEAEWIARVDHQHRTTRLVDAASFAAIFHDGQRYGDMPYVVHPLAVARACAAQGGSDDQVIAALLHDVVEDTACTIDAVRAAFGAEVAAIVASLTHQPDVPYSDYIDALPDEAVLVKLCDSRSNLSGLHAAGMSAGRRERLRQRYERNEAVLTARLATRPSPGRAT